MPHIAFVPPHKADAHLTRDGGRSSLCGYDRADIWQGSELIDHREGYHELIDYPCARCADVADRLQNGPRAAHV